MAKSIKKQEEERANKNWKEGEVISWLELSTLTALLTHRRL
jgi:hypothetical protein